MHQKRNRTTFNKCQISVLEHAFKHNNYPTPNIRDALAVQINIDSSRIQVWFQNRRAKLKRQVNQTAKRWFVIDPATNAVNLTPQPTSHQLNHQLQQQHQQHQQHQQQQHYPLLNQVSTAAAAVQLANSMDQCAAIQQQMALDLHLGTNNLGTTLQQHHNQQQHQLLDHGFLEQAACLYGGAASAEQIGLNQHSKRSELNEDASDQNKEPKQQLGDEASEQVNNGLFYGQSWLADANMDHNQQQQSHQFVDDLSAINTSHQQHQQQHQQLVITGHHQQQDHLTSSSSSSSSCSSNSISPPSSGCSIGSQLHPLMQESINLLDTGAAQNQHSQQQEQQMIGSQIKQSAALRILSQSGSQHHNQLFASIAAAQQQHQDTHLGASRFCDRLNIAVSALTSGGSNSSPMPSSVDLSQQLQQQQQQQQPAQQLNISGAPVKSETFNLQLCNHQSQQQFDHQQQNQNKPHLLQQQQQQQYYNNNNSYMPHIGVLRSVAEYLH